MRQFYFDVECEYLGLLWQTCHLLIVGGVLSYLKNSCHVLVILKRCMVPET